MTITLPRRAVLAVGLVVAILATTAGTAVGLVGPFTDVADNDTHAGNILAIYGAGITLGCTVPNTPPGSTYCPSNNVNRAQMASFLARLGGLNSGATNNFARVNPNSDLGAYCALADKLRGSFDRGPCWSTDSKLTDATSAHVSVAIGSDSFPIVAFYDASAGDLKVAHCETEQCASATVTTVDSTNDTGYSPSIAIGQNGLPFISYYDFTNTDLRLATCINIACTGTSTKVTVDNGVNVGQFSSAMLGFEGFPNIAYYDGDNGDAKFAYCTAADCSSRNLTLIEWAADVGKYISLTQTRSGRPQMSYWDEGNGELRIATCGDLTCETTGVDLQTPDADNVGSHTSITIGADGFPVVTYRDETTDRLKIAICLDALCSSATLRSPGFGRDADNGYFTQVAVGLDGIPIITHVTGPADGDDLQVLRCSDKACASTTAVGGSTNNILSTVPTVGLAIGVDGQPVVAYFDSSQTDIRILRPRLLALGEFL